MHAPAASRLLLSVALALATGCVSKDQAALSSPGGEQAARVRNAPPPGCTPQAAQRCEALDQYTCPTGAEPVIDYDRTCCPHFSCQPQCPVGAKAQSCEAGPAPSCPAGSELVIGSDDQCCPFYRCRPLAGTSGTVRCDGSGAACAKTLPYCGGALPVEIGLDQSCCPIYQCPCTSGGAFGGGGSAPSPVPEAGPTTTGSRDGSDTAGGNAMPVPPTDTCGCTYPTCAQNEVLVCLGTGACNAPCVCQGIGDPGLDCTTSQDCAPGSSCEPAPAADCPGCPVGMTCPPCFKGKCVHIGGVASGCSGNADCGGTGSGFECQISCQECTEGTMGCTCPQSGGAAPNPMDPNAPPTTTSPVRCEICAGACIAVPSCGRATDPTGGTTGVPPNGGSAGGSMGGSSGGVPVPPGACTKPDCANPMQVGFDEMTCCPVFTCSASCTQTTTPCAVPMCANPVFTGVALDSCCPAFCCPGDPGCPTSTPAPCKIDMECPMAQRCELPPGCATTNTMASAGAACVGICVAR